MNAVPEGLFVLNAQRQILFANQAALELVGGKPLVQVISRRLGEALDCVHAWDWVAGCGTGECCRRCGTATATLGAIEGSQTVRECQMTRRFGGEKRCVDLRLRSTPVQVGTRRWSVLAVSDVSAENRHHALERVFLHDVINLASGAAGILESLTALAPVDLRDYFRLSHDAVRELLEETQAQRDWLPAAGPSKPAGGG
jgi:hypothetical protein